MSEPLRRADDVPEVVLSKDLFYLERRDQVL